MTIQNCSKCGGTHFGSISCPYDDISLRKIEEYKPLEGEPIKFSDIVGTKSIDPKVLQMETVMKAMPQIELEVRHDFSDGLYARTLIIPAGVTLCGEIHKYRNLNILSQGTMLLYGEGQIQAPFIVVSPPGTKRIAHTITDCVWTTIHATDEIDVNKIEKYFIAKTEAEWLEFAGVNQLKLGLG